MGGPGGFVKNLTAEYMPAYSASIAALHQKVTTAVDTAQRIGTLAAIPQIPDERFSASNLPYPKFRPPWHLIIQVPSNAANSVWMTWDNNTAPVVGGPGYEIKPGESVTFEHGECLLTPTRTGAASTYVVDALGAIQFRAILATVLLLNYSD